MKYRQTGRVPPQATHIRGKKADRKRGPTPIRVTERSPGRNAECPCGSGVKFKKCCGKPISPTTAPSPYHAFRDVYSPEQQEMELQFVTQWGFTPSAAQLEMFMDGDVEGLTSVVARGLDTFEGNEKFAYAVRKLQLLVTPKNQRLISDEVKAKWEAALDEFNAGSTDSA